MIAPGRKEGKLEIATAETIVMVIPERINTCCNHGGSFVLLFTEIALHRKYAPPLKALRE